MIMCLALLGSCNDDHCSCYESFEANSIHVTDAAGSAVAGLTARTIRLSDMKDVTPPFFGEDVGDYVVVDDANVQDFDEKPAPILFSVDGNEGSASTRGVAYTDACHCHAFDMTDQPGLVLQ
jgi:hypothetical protein